VDEGSAKSQRYSLASSAGASSLQSILFVVSHAPLFNPDNGSPMEYETIRRIVSDPSGLDQTTACILRGLSERLIVFHPEDKGPASWERRQNVRDAMETLTAIASPDAVFSTVLGAKDKIKPRAIVEALGERAEQSLEAKDFESALTSLRDMGLLSVVGHHQVSELLDMARRRFASVISYMERQDQLLAQNNLHAYFPHPLDGLNSFGP